MVQVKVMETNTGVGRMPMGGNMMLKTLNLSGGGDQLNAPSWIAGRQEVERLHLREAAPEIGQHGIIGNGRAMRSVFEQIEIVAPTDSTVLIQGETGTGKELFAQAIHQLSRRRNAPLVTLNCAAIPAGLLESELFGHERGAFTGAVTQRIGRFEMAHGGTLFLDEIGEMALDLQVKLLRVLQEQAFERLGGTRTSHVNVRVVAATNRDLSQMVEEKEFRADLFYRLSVFPVSLPPLRERSEDIPALARHFVAKYAERMNKVVDDIPSETMKAMLAYDWPGNVRQLQNFIEHGVIVSQGRVFQPPPGQLQNRASGIRRSGKTLDDATRDHILETLTETKWVVGGRHGAAARLGIARTTLLSKMRRLRIESAQGKTFTRSARQHAFASMA
jgi:formate hydrogenlyase transcriptional activator